MGLQDSDQNHHGFHTISPHPWHQVGHLHWVWDSNSSHYLNLLLDTTPLEQQLLHLERLKEDRRVSLQHNEAHKVRTKAQLDQQFWSCIFSPSDLVLNFWCIQRQEYQPLKVYPPLEWPLHCHLLYRQGEYEISHLEGGTLDNPINGLYLKKFYPQEFPSI